MNHKHYFFYAGLLLALFFYIVACNKKSPFNNEVFITAATTSTYTTISADSTGAQLAIRVSSSDSVTTSTSITLNTDTSLVAAYNAQTGKKFNPLPPGSYTLTGNTVTIQPGNATSVNGATLQILSVKDFKQGVSYLIPVTITNAGLPIIQASKTLYIEVKPVIIAKYVAQMTDNSFSCDFSKNNDALKAMSALTMETRVYVNNFQNYTPYISSIMGIEGSCLLRFGDVTVPMNTLQFNGLGGANVPGFSAGVWYHIAMVYNGASTTIYVNGQQMVTTPASGTFDITNGFNLGRSYQFRPLDGYLSEARVWSRALTQSEIINGMCGVDPASPGLVAYWKLNEGTGMVAHDLSGNGHDATAGLPVTWKPDVRCN